MIKKQQVSWAQALCHYSKSFDVSVSPPVIIFTSWDCQQIKNESEDVKQTPHEGPSAVQMGNI